MGLYIKNIRIQNVIQIQTFFGRTANDRSSASMFSGVSRPCGIKRRQKLSPSGVGTKTSANSSAMDLVLYCNTMYRVASVGIEESTDCTISQSLNPA